MTEAKIDPREDALKPKTRIAGPLSTDPSWMDQAWCQDSDIEFVSSATGQRFHAEQREALEVCAGCPVKRECLEYAFEQASSTREGVYGGTVGMDRWPLRNHPDRIEILLAAQA